MSEPRELLAKSIRSGVRVTLASHSLDTERAAALLFHTDRRWGWCWPRFFKLEASDVERFLLNLRIAALFHDIGKANEDFLAAVSRPGYLPQTLRHEHLSAILLHLPELRSWLALNPQLDVESITAAVLSHHLKAAPDGVWRWCQARTAKRNLRLYLAHDDVKRILARVAEIASLRDPPSLHPSVWSDASPWGEAYGSGIKAARTLSDSCRSSRARRSFVASLKAGVIVADAVASGLVREGCSIPEWIEQVAHRDPIAPGEVSEKILGPRIVSLERRSRRAFSWHRFQDGAARQGRRTLLLAACGAGKTLAAWRWAETRCSQEALGRVVFLYPTRGTATEGFRDYVGWAPESDAILLHGTAAYELEGMAANPSEATKGKELGLSEPEARLFALGVWDRRFFSATVDQFLSFLEHRYSALCLLPALADAAVIVDEVHSFDRRMFDSLVNFVRAFDGPILCMTATLAPHRQRELAAAGLEIYPSEDDRQDLRDLADQERHPRYALVRISGEDAAFAEACRAHAEGWRVLWVVNTVARCQRGAIRLAGALGESVLCYHSRFRLKDRQVRHHGAVEAFQQRNRPAIAITTQVCEMSLDLDADVLITELAPLSALIQRFGRANRHRARGDDFRARILVYEPERAVPYDRAELESTRAALGDLGEREFSQEEITALLERYGRAEPLADDYSRFLDSGYFATPGEFRDTDDFSQSCVLESDLADVRAAIEGRASIDGWIVGVPRGAVRDADARPHWLPAHLRVAPGAPRYDDRWGFLDKEVAG